MNKKIGKNYIFLRKFCKKLYNLSENMAKIDALFTKFLTFLRFILNFPPPPSRIFKNIHPCLQFEFIDVKYGFYNCNSKRES